jgi:hypothetical protein
MRIFPVPLREIERSETHRVERSEMHSRARERGLVSSFDTQTRASILSEAKSIGRASPPINQLPEDFLQKRYNFSGDSDSGHVSGGTIGSLGYGSCG